MRFNQRKINYNNKTLRNSQHNKRKLNKQNKKSRKPKSKQLISQKQLYLREWQNQKDKKEMMKRSQKALDINMNNQIKKRKYLKDSQIL